MELAIFNMESQYQQDMKTGVGIEIDTPVPVTKKEIIRNPRGIYSSLFGGDISDTDELQKRYQCSCGEKTGKFHERSVCEKCHTPVTFQDNELEKTGWMSLCDPYVLITPRLFRFIEKVLKPKRLDEMLKFDHRFDANGVIIYDTTVDAKNPYANIGINEFARRFDEILEVMADKTKELEIAFIKKHRGEIFTRRIPVLNLLLRPVVLISNTTFNYDPINMYYAEMMSHVHYINNNINNEHTQSSLQILYELQRKWVSLDAEIIKQKINGKKHTIRQFVLGSRVNFSARHVVVPNLDTVKIDSLKIPYYTFCEFYKFHIMNIYKKIYRVTVNELNDRWYTLVMTRDPSILHIINILIKRTKGGLRMYVNRPPTIALGSIQVFKVTAINEDFDDLTASLPLCILPLMNCDFDGDCLSFIPLIDSIFADKMQKYFSSQRLVVNPSTGLYNRRVGLIKDQLVGLYSFCNDSYSPQDFASEDDKFTIITPEILHARDMWYKRNRRAA